MCDDGVAMVQGLDDLGIYGILNILVHSLLVDAIITERCPSFFGYLHITSSITNNHSYSSCQNS